MHKISPIFLLLLSFIATVMLSACGSKGDLYQTPEPVANEQKQNDTQNADEAQLEKLD